jgi:hypothetical protein
MGTGASSAGSTTPADENSASDRGAHPPGRDKSQRDNPQQGDNPEKRDNPQ